MTKRIGRTTNTTDETAQTSEILNSSTYTEILAANDRRISLEIQNDNSQDVYLWFNEETPVDSDAIILFKKSEYVSFPDNIDTGAIYAKSVSGTPTLRIKES